MEPAIILNTLVSIAAIQVLGWAIPGPNHLSILTASVAGGRRAGLAAAAGIASGAVTWTVLAVSGIAVMFELFPQLFSSIRIAGAFYLIYLGIRAFRSRHAGFMLTPGTSNGLTKKTSRFMNSYLIMMTNPKAVLFFGAILTTFIPADSPKWMMMLIVVEIGVLGMILNSFAAFFFSTPAVVRGFERAGATVSVVFGLIFCALGVLVAYEALF